MERRSSGRAWRIGVGHVTGRLLPERRAADKDSSDVRRMESQRPGPPRTRRVGAWGRPTGSRGRGPRDQQDGGAHFAAQGSPASLPPLSTGIFLPFESSTARQVLRSPRTLQRPARQYPHQRLQLAPQQIEEHQGRRSRASSSSQSQNRQATIRTERSENCKPHDALTERNYCGALLWQFIKPEHAQVRSSTPGIQAP